VALFASIWSHNVPLGLVSLRSAFHQWLCLDRCRQTIDGNYCGCPRGLTDIENFANEDEFFWQSAKLIRGLVARGENFNSLNS